MIKVDICEKILGQRLGCQGPSFCLTQISFSKSKLSSSKHKVKLEHRLAKAQPLVKTQQ